MEEWGLTARGGHLYHQLCHQKWIWLLHPAGSHRIVVAANAAPPTSARDSVLVARITTCHHPLGSGRVVAQPQGGERAVATHRTVVRSTPAHARVLSLLNCVSYSWSRSLLKRPGTAEGYSLKERFN